MDNKSYVRIWANIFAILAMVGLCGCTMQPEDSAIVNDNIQSEKVICVQCGEEIEATDIFCRYCGYSANSNDVQTEPVANLVDYSDFGFIQTFGLTEWVRIEDGDFTDRNNATVTSSNSGEPCLVLSFSNNYIEVRAFNSNYSHEYQGHFLGKRTDGTLDNTFPYKTVSNYVLELQTTNNKNVEILDVQIIAGIPIVQIKAGSPAYSINGYYIPTEFIDWTREPITAGNLSPITYYIKPELIQ